MFDAIVRKLRGVSADYDPDTQTWTIDDAVYGGATGYARQWIDYGYIEEC